MQTFKVGDMVVLEEPYAIDEKLSRGDVGCVVAIHRESAGVYEQIVNVKFWTDHTRNHGYSAWRLKPLTS